MSGYQKSRDHEITVLLQAVRAGDARATGELLAVTYQEVRRMAELTLKGERPDHTLQPTALAHEAMQYFLNSDAVARLKDRHHYFATIRLAMKHVLIDHERHRQSLKAGGEFERQPMRSSILGIESAKLLSPVELLELLEKLSDKMPRASEVVMLHVLEGLPQAEVADRLEISLSTVESDFRMARGWLRRELDMEAS